MANVQKQSSTETLSVADLIAGVDWEKVRSQGGRTLAQIEGEMQALGFPPDSHDYLHQ